MTGYLEFGYDGYSADRLLLGFKAGTDIDVVGIRVRGNHRVRKAETVGDMALAARITAAMDRLFSVHENPRVHPVPSSGPQSASAAVPHAAPSGQGRDTGRSETVRRFVLPGPPPAPDKIDFKPYARGPYRPPGAADVVPLTGPPAKSDSTRLSLLDDFPRGDPDVSVRDADPHDRAPAARFHATADIQADPACHWEPGRFFLGLVGGRMITGPDKRPYLVGGDAIGVADDRHIITLAGSRAGKGRSAIVPNLLTYRGSVLAIDPKGELATITARHRAEVMKQEVRVLDPFGVAVGYPHNRGKVTGFNPIAAMRPNALVEDAALIADAIVMPEDGRDPHWNDSARAFIEGLVLHVSTHPNYADRASLVTVRLLAGQGADTDDATAGAAMKALIKEMKENTADLSGIVLSAALDYEERPSGEQGSMLSTVRRHLKFIDLFRDPGNPLGRLTLEHPGFALSDLKSKPEGTTVYLCLPARHIGTCGRWLRLFVNLVLQAMEITHVERLPGGVPVLAVLDEFASLGYLKQIEDAAAQIASFGVTLWPILQDLGQLKALYGERWETFMANAGLVQAFGNSDLTTLEWLSKRLGTTLVQMGGLSSGRMGDDKTLPDITRSELYELMTPEEVARFFGREDWRFRQLVIWAGREHPFMVLQRAFYDRHGLGRGPDGAPLFDLVPP